MTSSSELDDIKIEFIIMVWEDISHYLATFHIKHFVYIYKEKDKSLMHISMKLKKYQLTSPSS